MFGSTSRGLALAANPSEFSVQSAVSWHKRLHRYMLHQWSCRKLRPEPDLFILYFLFGGWRPSFRFLALSLYDSGLQLWSATAGQDSLFPGSSDCFRSTFESLRSEAKPILLLEQKSSVRRG